MEQEIYKWIYKYEPFTEGSIDNSAFQIIPDKDFIKPPTLFKYYSLNDNTVESLINNKVYATHPCQFNDIFDCSSDLIDFDDTQINTSFLSKTFTEEVIKKEIENFPEQVEEFVKRHFKELIYRKMGILCLTENNNNYLMWSYYSNHKGFVVEYDYQTFPFVFFGPFPVNYQNTVEPIKTTEVNIPLAMLFQSNIKKKIWEKENEWRILIPSLTKDMISPCFELLKQLGGEERLFKINQNSVKSIILGNRFFKPEELKQISEKQIRISIKQPDKEGNDKDLSRNRIKLLDFIFLNNIKASIVVELRREFEIKTNDFFLSKEEDKYIINAC